MVDGNNRIERSHSAEGDPRGRSTTPRRGSNNWRRQLYGSETRSTSVPPETRNPDGSYHLSGHEERNSLQIARAMTAYDAADEDLRVIINDEENNRGTPLERVRRAEDVMQRFEELNEWAQNFMLHEQGRFHPNDLAGLQDYYTRHSIMVAAYRENERRALQSARQPRGSSGPSQDQTRKRPPGPGGPGGPSQKKQRPNA